MALSARYEERVYVTGGCPSVCPLVCLSHHSIAAAACGGFAAERRANRRYRSRAAGAGRQVTTAPQHGGIARRSAANAGSAILQGCCGYGIPLGMGMGWVWG